jgi:hypothetical protein
MEKLFEALSQDIMVTNNDDTAAKTTNKPSGGGMNDDHSDYDLNFEDEFDGGDGEDDEDNDLQMIETNQGWVTVRSSAVEEQSSALQMILLLTEKLQEYYYPYIEQTMHLLTKLLLSPNEDIRSHSIVILPELIRSTGKALPNNRMPLKELTFFCLGRILAFVEQESSIDLIMTGLQAMRQILLYACMDWNDIFNQQQELKEQMVNTLSNSSTSVNTNSSEFSNSTGNGNNHNPFMSLVNPENKLQEFLSKESKKQTWIKLLDDSQMLSISQCLKLILRESLQKRAVLQAEKQMEEREDEEEELERRKTEDAEDDHHEEEAFPLDGAPSASHAKSKKSHKSRHGKSHSTHDDHDDTFHNKDTFEVEDLMEEENLFFQQSLELHYNISEVMNILFQTHTFQFFQIFYQEFHEMLINFTNSYSNAEDKRFAFLILSDVLEFGLSPSASSSSETGQTATIHSHKDFVENYLKQLIPILHSFCTHTPSSSTSGMEDEEEIDYELLRTIVYMLGILYEQYADTFPQLLNQFLTESLMSLHQLMSSILAIEQQHQSRGEDNEDREVIGFCKDNVISSIGLIAQKLFVSLPDPVNHCNNGINQVHLGMNVIQPQQIQLLFTHWLQLLPLQYDLVRTRIFLLLNFVSYELFFFLVFLGRRYESVQRASSFVK